MRVLLGATGDVERTELRLVRGIAQEDRCCYDPSDRIVARVLPEDAEDELVRLDAAVVAAEEALAAAKRARREFLVAQVPRARLVRASDAEEPQEDA